MPAGISDDCELYKPYIDLGVTDGVVKQSLPAYDDGLSPPIIIDVQFPFGCQDKSQVYVSMTRQTIMLYIYNVHSIIVCLEHKHKLGINIV